ncbi:MAG: undecaprenyl-diphosphate phosphatase [Lachnospiraceae bacterium]|nr:undecaprenyl-diphosphate phosphatase [Lachnospiraceae bacterium]
MLDILIAILFGLVEGITEWLPISSTGHMILLEEFISFENVSEDFFSMFDVVVQLGAILAVVVLFWSRLFPFKKVSDKKHPSGHITIDMDIIRMWIKVLIGCIPAAVVGILLDDFVDEHFYNGVVVSLALIIFGVAFILIENWNKGRTPAVNSIEEMNIKTILIIGCFQLLAAIFPGTSRSGATIVGALLIGVSRTTAAEFTFFMAVPVMAGASLLKLLKFGLSFTALEAAVLLIGMAVAFVTSLIVIRFLLDYIRKHDFKVFGYYRIILGVIVLLYFAIAG